MHIDSVHHTAMNTLIVYAHPEPASFSAALKNTSVATLTELGHEVVVSDLYRMGFAPVLDADEFAQRANQDVFDPSREQEHAYAHNAHSLDVRTEQAKVAAADLLLLHFPIWWFAMPAILKGWAERVMSRGFAYSAGRKYGTGHFQGKRAMLCVTTGTASSLYEPNGIDGDLHHVLWPIHNGLLAYTGFTVLPAFAAWMPGKVSDAERAAYLAAWRQRLHTLDATEPLFFHPWCDYDESQRLKPGVLARSGVQWNPRAGQTFVDAASRYTPSVS